MFKIMKKHYSSVIAVILVFLLLTLIFHTFSSVSIVDFEPVITSWVDSMLLT